jgi:leucyl aminopeptidase
VTYRFVERADARTVPIVPVETEVFAAWLKGEPAAIRSWVESAGFAAKAGQVSLVADARGALVKVLLGVDRHDGFWAYAGLPETLPAGTYAIDARFEPAAATGVALGWALACYRFDRYKADRGKAKPFPALVWPAGADRGHVERAARATYLVRDLVNTPAADMGPEELAEAAAKVARAGGTTATAIVGDALVRRNYPTIHAVGRASARAPRLIDFKWGRASAPKVTLVGKGVCFDTGGLDLKTADGMLRMKKDMAGAAEMLGLAAMIMDAGLDVRLRVLVPAVENSVAGNAYRPADVVRTRKGITVEVNNTDAEGRLILCDALAEADREKPALVADCATLTGAARVALGPELPALFTNDDRVAADLARLGEAVSDPVWRLPLWKPYRRLLDSKVADISNVSEGSFGGAITAALYLQEFVSAGTPWVHLDVMAWNTSAKPGRPIGGEAMGMRALYALIAERFGGKRAPRRNGKGGERRTRRRAAARS